MPRYSLCDRTHLKSYTDELCLSSSKFQEGAVSIFLEPMSIQQCFSVAFTHE